MGSSSGHWLCRTLILYDRTDPPALFSDLAGITAATFAPHASGNLDAALSAPRTKIRGVINDLTSGRTEDFEILRKRAPCRRHRCDYANSHPAAGQIAESGAGHYLEPVRSSDRILAVPAAEARSGRPGKTPWRRVARGRRATDRSFRTSGPGSGEPQTRRAYRTKHQCAHNQRSRRIRPGLSGQDELHVYS